MKIEIEIPDPPEGWQLDGYRVAGPNEKWWNGTFWACLMYGSTIYTYPVAIKAKPLWTPSPELVAVLKPGWYVRDNVNSRIVWWHKYKPKQTENDWISGGEIQEVRVINECLLPPLTIPWDKCCFRIGGDE
jgi:hypothetical protein